MITHPEKFNTISKAELERHLRSNHDFLDGICITGGEPSLYSSLPAFIDQLRDLGFTIKLDTNGSNPKLLQELIDDKKLDYIAMDIKAPLDERYNRLSGVKVDLAKINKSIQIIMDSTIEYEFRTTVVPTLMTLENLQEIIDRLCFANKFAIQQFVPHNAHAKRLRNIKPFDKSELETIRKDNLDKIDNIIIRG